MKSVAYKLATSCILILLSIVVTTVQAASQTLDVSAVVLSKNNCQFQNPASGSLAFGTLNPANPIDVPASTTLRFVCRGADPVATFLISDNDGLHATGPDANRMQHASNSAAYLPYSLSLSPTFGTAPKNAIQTLTVNGTVLGTDYQTALGGSYADTVTILIQP